MSKKFHDMTFDEKTERIISVGLTVIVVAIAVICVIFVGVLLAMLLK